MHVRIEGVLCRILHSECSPQAKGCHRVVLLLLHLIIKCLKDGCHVIGRNCM